MKSVVGLFAAFAAAAAFALAYWFSVRAGAGWLDSQYLFLIALPYNAVVLRLFGESHFSPDALAEVVGAAACETAAAYLAGALVEALLRGLVRLVRRRA